MQKWVEKRIEGNTFRLMQAVNHKNKENKEEEIVIFKEDNKKYKFVFDWIDENCCGVTMFKQIDIVEKKEKEEVKE
jgi:hypothetical protein